MTDILHPARMAQLKDFKNMHLYKGFTPIDIDFSMDIQGQIYILGELKLAGVDVPTGQMIHLQSWLYNCIVSDKDALLVIAEHSTHPSEPIDVGNCNVVKMFWVDGGEIKSMDNVDKPVNVICERYLLSRGVDESYVSTYRQSVSDEPEVW
jgi:hypothetical protein